MGRIELSVAIAALAAFAGCDYAMREEFKTERAEKQYQSAIADYTAGRLDAAENGFRSAVKADPGNASARFQLAVLLQDARQDYLGAIAAYRSYLLLEPSSDKAKLAKERAANCERLLARQLAAKMNLTDNQEIVEELNLALAAKDKAEASNAALMKQIESLQKELATVKKESEGRLALLRRMGGVDEDEAAGPALLGDRRSADVPEDASAAPKRVDAAKAVPDDGDGPVRLNPEALALNEEAERTESELLPRQTADNKAPVKLTSLGEAFRTKEHEGKDDPLSSMRPATYVVQPGDTLYSIARRFYGKKSAWRRIQEANKATVSTDGKVRAGAELKLP